MAFIWPNLKFTDKEVGAQRVQGVQVLQGVLENLSVIPLLSQPSLVLPSVTVMCMGVCVFVFRTCLGHTSHEVMSLSEPYFPCLVRALKEIVVFKIHVLISLPYSLFICKDEICNFSDCSTNRAF